MSKPLQINDVSGWQVEHRKDGSTCVTTPTGASIDVAEIDALALVQAYAIGAQWAASKLAAPAGLRARLLRQHAEALEFAVLTTPRAATEAASDLEGLAARESAR